MKQRLLFLLFLLLAILNTTVMATENTSVWLDASSPSNQQNRSNSTTTVRWLILDTKRLLQQLNTAPNEIISQQIFPKTTIEIVLPTGQNVFVEVQKSPIMEPALAEKYPRIQTWKIIGNANPIVSGRIDITPAGFHAILSLNNGETVMIDPKQSAGKSYYVSRRHQSNRESLHQCQLHPKSLTIKSVHRLQRSLAKSTGESLQTYRLALAATAAYTQFFGGTVEKGLAAIVTTINRVNEIYERDLAIRLILIAENNQIIYTNSVDDPYTNNSSSNLLSDQNQINIDRVIGINNYDIGHVFSQAQGGGDGIAILGSVCQNDIKAIAATSLNTPLDDIFSIDFVAHEIGHQFGAKHTFNGNKSGCVSRELSLGYEPGSGSTIMAYAGICGTDNLQKQSDAVFHSASIQQIINYSREDSGSTCAKTTSLNNTIPIADAGNNFTIPARTPFLLSAKASDADNDQLTYGWDQMDSGSASAVDIDTGDNAIIRSYLPTTSPQRSIPKYSDLLAGTSTKGEILPTTSRTLKFSLVVRDGKGGVAMDGMKLEVHDTGTAFAIKEPSTAISVKRNQNLSIIWEVANTDVSPINCNSVDIALSSDGGEHFSILKEQQQNDGSITISIPADAIENSTARLKISCHNNVFFALSPSNFIISGFIEKIPETKTAGSFIWLVLLFLIALFVVQKYRFTQRLK
jgi:hypothetical protein